MLGSTSIGNQSDIDYSFMIHALIKGIEHRMSVHSLLKRIKLNIDRFYL